MIRDTKTSNSAGIRALMNTINAFTYFGIEVMRVIILVMQLTIALNNE